MTQQIQQTTEFASDAVALLSRLIHRAAKRGTEKVGTEHLLYMLLDDNEKPGAALVPGFQTSTSVSGQILARMGNDDLWVRTDEDTSSGSGDDSATSTSSSDHDHDNDDRIEADAAWREALWLSVRRSRPGPAREAPRPVPSGALRAAVLGALRQARREGSYTVHERHIARALLELPMSRAVEQMVLCRVDLAASAAALDAQAEAVRGGATPWTAEHEAESGSLALLRQSGLLGERGSWWMRGLTSWMARSAGDGSPILMVLRTEAVRQAERYGRDTAGPAELLLAVLALDRALTLAGKALPAELAEVNSVAEELRSCGVRHAALVRAAVALVPATGHTVPSPSEPFTPAGKVEMSAEGDQLVARVRLLAAERGAGTVGTAHVLAVLLDEEGTGEVVGRLLGESGADPDELAVLRDRLDGRLGA
ncbi:Clp protease N-terminal domain-containing protein [Streptomyces sp. NPDC093109]|uniref:Clp protease N-terminal domain-containing protein n=1 Tax=Streptomyces sp. NPDC093109 TaxID=3154977 RepID=UPI00344E976C